MIYALQRAYEEYRADCDHYGIAVDAKNHIIEYQGAVRVLRDTTPTKLCRAIIRQYIKRAKEAEAAAQLEKQSSLFGDQ